MKTILLFGAGKSATCLIGYLIRNAGKNQWQVIVADGDIELARRKLANAAHTRPVQVDVMDDEKRNALIEQADVVISMLPPALHFLVAKSCVKAGRHLLTASYLDDGIKRLEKEIKKKGLIFIGEMGLDPGIDHMSAMQMVDNIKDQGGLIKSFKSHCGGLVAPESDDNPWHYKITWNPANIVNAGKAGAVYKENGHIIKINYPDVFNQHGTVSIPGYGRYACYPNRNSLPYMSLYGLESTATFIRTTLRHPHFCTGWKYIIKAGLTNEDAASAKNYTGKAVAEWFLYCLRAHTQSGNFTDFLTKQVATEERMLVQELFSYLGLFSNEIIPGTLPAHSSVLQYLLETRLKLGRQDKDLIVMLHEIDYEVRGKYYSAKSSMAIKGEDHLITAMAKTVGLPLAIAAELILNNTIRLKGLHIPVIKDIYEPVLAKLKDNKIYFREI